MVAGGFKFVTLHAEGRHQPDPEVEFGIVGRDFQVTGGAGVERLGRECQEELNVGFDLAGMQRRIRRPPFYSIEITPFRLKIQ